MSLSLVDRLVNAVLYEGYILYPYRSSSAKNRQRFTYGRVYPDAFSQMQRGIEPCTLQTQCLAQPLVDNAALTAKVRFLQPMNRTVGRLPEPLLEWPADAEPAFQLAPTLQVDKSLYQTWQESVEREITLPNFPLNTLFNQPQTIDFSFAASRQLEPIRDQGGAVVGVVERQQADLAGQVTVTAESIADRLYKLTIHLQNQTPLPAEPPVNTEDNALLLRTFVSTHVILTVQSAEFLSLMDPPPQYKQATAACQNQGVWPVLVGEADQRDTLLASPIILYDYPEIAPESPGDLFDSTEIDEILTLRIMTLSDEEKWEMSQIDDRARRILQRSESIAQDDFMRMHGTLRNIQPAEDNQ